MRQEDDDHTNRLYIFEHAKAFRATDSGLFALNSMPFHIKSRIREEWLILLLRQTEEYMPFAQKCNKCTSDVLLHCIVCWPIRDLSETINLMAFVRDCFPIAYARIKLQKMKIDSMAKNKMRQHEMGPRFVCFAWKWDTLTFMKWNGETHVFFMSKCILKESSIGELKRAKGRDMECVWYVLCSHLKYFNIHLLMCIICDASRLRSDLIWVSSEHFSCSNG